MGNGLVFQIRNKSLYKKSDGSYLWVVKNGNKSTKSPVAIKISKGFNNNEKSVILIHNKYNLLKRNKFQLCQYLGYKSKTNIYKFHTVNKIYYASDYDIKKYEIKLMSYSIDDNFCYCFYVIENNKTT